MTVSGALINWLKGFNEEGRKLDRIDTDKQSAEVESYSIVKEPVVNSKKNVLGEETVTEHYTLMARLAGSTEDDRVDNNAFGEAMEAWIEEKNRRRQYPELPAGEVVEVKVTTPFYAGRTETNDIIYQMTVALKYEKKRQ